MPRKTKNSTAIAGLPVDTYKHLQAAFDHFNAKLFDGALAPAMLSINASKRNVYGYCAAERFEHAETGVKASEINVNADEFARGLRLVLSTLVHEMAHHWQFTMAPETLSRNGYHNKIWADKMEAIGLMPSSTGEEGGKRTGQNMTHYIIDHGPYAAAFDAMPKSIKLDWQGIARTATTKKRPAANKVKYVCAECDAKAWGKEGLGLYCQGTEEEPHPLAEMQPE